MASSLLTGLVAYYAMEGNSNDSLGVYNGTDTGVSYGTTYGKIRQGATYGSPNFTVLPSGFGSVFTPNSNSISMSCWVYITNLAVEQGIICAANTSGGNDVFYFYTVGSGNKVGFGIAGATFLYEVDVVEGGVLNNWAHFVCTATYTTGTTGTLNFYLNGNNIGSAAYNPSNVGTIGGATTMNFGRFGAYAGGSYFNGYVDEVGFWNRVLTATEIATLYNSGKGLTYPFVQGNGMMAFFNRKR